MFTVRIDFFVFGYRSIRGSEEDLSYAAGILLREKIPSVIKNDGWIFIREKDFPRTAKLLSDSEKYVFSDCLGFLGAIKRIKYKKTLLFSSLISLLLVCFSSSMVWDVRVSGNSKIPNVTVIDGLEKSGFSTGDFWLSHDLSKIEADFLKNNSDFSWININRRGTVAYVSVIENDRVSEKNEIHKNGYANIVAQRDSVIEEITVKNGTAVVKVGDSVKKGDLLISGVNSSEFGVSYCYAEGTVIGRVCEGVTSEIDREYTETQKIGEKIRRFDVKIFDFSINIFNFYGNSPEKCDIIKEIKTYSLFGKAKLPIEIYTESTPIYRVVEDTYTDAELVRATEKIFQRKLWEKLKDSDLVKLKTNGKFTEKGYLMRCDAVYLEEIGEALSFSGE